MGNAPAEGRHSLDVSTDGRGDKSKNSRATSSDLVRDSEHVRDRFFLQGSARTRGRTVDQGASPQDDIPRQRSLKAARWYRQYLSEEVLGRFDEPYTPFNPRTRQIYDTDKWVGYEVVLDVWPDVFAWGILLVPNDLKPGERRPVVVCQHGRNGVPKDAIEGDDAYYGKFAARLADQGFITFAPHNLYRGEDRYR